MRIPLYVLGFGLVLSVASLTAQTPQQQQPTTPVNPSTPATGVGDGAQSKAGTPVQPATSVQPSTTPPSATGGVAGAASSSATPSADTQDSAGGVSALTDSDLQSQIQNALSKEPTLTGDSPRVSVSGDTVELAGAVGTNKEKVTATRIVQSYTGSKKLVNKLTIGGRSDKSLSTPPSGSKPPQR